MDTTLYLKPREGLTVRDPRTKKPIPAHGAALPNTSFFRRRRKDGDLVTTTAAAIKKGEEASAKALAETAKED